MLGINDMDDVIDPGSIIGYWNQEQRELPNPQPYLYSGMLKPTPVQQGTIRVYFGKNEVPHGLDLTADGVKANFSNSRGSFFSDVYHVLDYKKGRQMQEHYMAQIRKALYYHQMDPGFVASLTKLVYNDQTLLIDDAMFSREKAFEQELNTGKIQVTNNGVAEPPQDFHMPNNHKLGVNIPWGQKNSTVIKNLNDAQRFIADDNNSNETLAIMNDHTFLKMISSGDVVNGTNKLQMDLSNVPTNQNEARQFVVHDTGLTIMIYDKGIHGSRFIPDGKVILVPQKVIGRLIYAPTNEQLNLPGEPGVKVSESNGLTLSSKKSFNPTGAEIIASQRVLPVIDDIQNILSINVGQTVSATGSPYSVNPLPTASVASAPTTSTPNSSNSSKNNSSSKKSSK